LTFKLPIFLCLQNNKSLLRNVNLEGYSGMLAIDKKVKA